MNNLSETIKKLAEVNEYIELTQGTKYFMPSALLVRKRLIRTLAEEVK